MFGIQPKPNKYYIRYENWRNCENIWTFMRVERAAVRIEKHSSNIKHMLRPCVDKSAIVTHLVGGFTVNSQDRLS